MFSILTIGWTKLLPSLEVLVHLEAPPPPALPEGTRLRDECVLNMSVDMDGGQSSLVSFMCASRLFLN